MFSEIPSHIYKMEKANVYIIMCTGVDLHGHLYVTLKRIKGNMMSPVSMN